MFLSSSKRYHPILQDFCPGFSLDHISYNAFFSQGLVVSQGKLQRPEYLAEQKCSNTRTILYIFYIFSSDFRAMMENCICTYLHANLFGGNARSAINHQLGGNLVGGQNTASERIQFSVGLKYSQWNNTIYCRAKIQPVKQYNVVWGKITASETRQLSAGVTIQSVKQYNLVWCKNTAR